MDYDSTNLKGSKTITISPKNGNVKTLVQYQTPDEVADDNEEDDAKDLQSDMILAVSAAI